MILYSNTSSDSEVSVVQKMVQIEQKIVTKGTKIVIKGTKMACDRNLHHVCGQVGHCLVGPRMILYGHLMVFYGLFMGCSWSFMAKYQFYWACIVFSCGHRKKEPNLFGLVFDAADEKGHFI